MSTEFKIHVKTLNSVDTREFQILNFQLEINHDLAEGWTLHGPIIYIPGFDTKCPVLLQSLVLYDR